jgi:hypothetical protein
MFGRRLASAGLEAPSQRRTPAGCTLFTLSTGASPTRTSPGSHGALPGIHGGGLSVRRRTPTAMAPNEIPGSGKGLRILCGALVSGRQDDLRLVTEKCHRLGRLLHLLQSLVLRSGEAAHRVRVLLGRLAKCAEAESGATRAGFATAGCRQAVHGPCASQRGQPLSMKHQRLSRRSLAQQPLQQSPALEWSATAEMAKHAQELAKEGVMETPRPQGAWAKHGWKRRMA